MTYILEKYNNTLKAWHQVGQYKMFFDAKYAAHWHLVDFIDYEWKNNGNCVIAYLPNTDQPKFRIIS